MSITATLYGGLELAEPVALTSTTAEIIVTSTDKDTIVASISLVNEGASAAKITLYRFDGASNKAIWHQNLDSHSSAIIQDIPIRLYAGEAIKAKSDQASGITITPIIIRTGSYEAFNRPT